MAEQVTGGMIPDDLQERGVLRYGDNGEHFTVATGRNQALYEQIHNGSQEPVMRTMVPKDAAQRFASPEAFEAWYAKDRFLVSLRAQDGALAAVVWHGPSSLPAEVASLQGKARRLAPVLAELSLADAQLDFAVPDSAQHTFAIRTYEGFRGLPKPSGQPLSLARVAMQLAEGHYARDMAGQGRPLDGQHFWLETNESNAAGERNGALYLYEKAGYTAIGRYINPDATNPEWRVMMLKPVSEEVTPLPYTEV